MQCQEIEDIPHERAPMCHMGATALVDLIPCVPQLRVDAPARCMLMYTLKRFNEGFRGMM